MKPLLLLGVLVVLVTGCDGTTGSALVRFSGAAGGPTDIAPAQPYLTGYGYSLVLERARLHFGAVYLNRNVPLTGAGESDCVLPGTYVGQLFGPLDLDLLSPTLVDFPSAGEGTQTEARTAEVWLLEGDIGRTDDDTVVLDVSGTAEKDGSTYPFTGKVTIGQNRALPPPDVAMPGANPICRQRIVTPIAVDLMPQDGARLVLRVDPRRMFDGVDFTLAPPDPASPGAYLIPDEKGGIGDQLFHGLRRNDGVYAFSFEATR